MGGGGSGAGGGGGATGAAQPSAANAAFAIASCVATDVCGLACFLSRHAFHAGESFRLFCALSMLTKSSGVEGRLVTLHESSRSSGIGKRLQNRTRALRQRIGQSKQQHALWMQPFDESERARVSTFPLL